MKEIATDCSIYRDRELSYVLRASVKHFNIATYGIFSELHTIFLGAGKLLCDRNGICNSDVISTCSAPYMSSVVSPEQ